MKGLEEEAQSNRMCYRYIKMDGVEGRGMTDEGVGGRSTI